MGLFSKKKKPEIKKLPDFPSYEPQLREFKKPFFKSTPIPEQLEEFELPIRKPSFQKPTSFGQERPLFVKVEKYKTAVRHIDEIKAKLAEAEKILRNLNKIKIEEDEELKAWQEDIENIKIKLMEVDKTLFEI